jgi:hypothetical protein
MTHRHRWSMPACIALVACLLALVPAHAHAQTSTGSIAGAVVDERSGVPLERARVTVDGLTTRAHTNEHGRFVLADVPAGPGVLEVSLVGYALARLDVVVPAGGTLELTIALAEGSGTYNEEVEVKAAPPARETGVASQITIGSADIEQLRSTLTDDPMRAVQSLAGVGGTDDFRSDFSIRAAPFDHLSVTLDGIPSSLLRHTVRNATDTGSLAMINADILEGTSVLFGSYPQRFGDRTGSQVDFRTRDGSRVKPHVQVAVSAIASSLVAEGPIGRARRGSWLVTGRVSYMGWIINQIDREATGSFTFGDTQAKAVYDLSPRHTLSATLVAGRSRWDENDDDPGQNSLEVGLNRTVLSGVTLRSSLGKSTVLTQQLYGVFNTFENRAPSALPLTRGSERDVSYRATAVTPGPRGTSFEGGVHLQALGASLDEFRYFGSERFTTGFDDTAGRAGGFVLARLQPHRALTITPGVRVDWFGSSDETLASPWIQAELGLPGRFLVSGGGGLYRQSPDLFQAANPFGGRVHAERARHLDVGLAQDIGAGWRWQVTWFDRAEDDMLFLANTEPRLVGDRPQPPSELPAWENALDGDIHGLELGLSRRAPNGFSGWIGYAYARARYDDLVRQESFPGDAEQRHNLTMFGSYRLSDRTSVSGRFRWATNVPLIGYYQRVDDLIRLGTERNRVRLSDYIRLDLRATRTFDVRDGRISLFVEVLNATNRRNQRGLEDPGYDRFGFVREPTEDLLPIIPSAGIRWEF